MRNGNRKLHADILAEDCENYDSYDLSGAGKLVFTAGSYGKE